MLWFHNPCSRSLDAECANSAPNFPGRGTSELWETGVAAFHISVLFVTLTQLSGIHSVCMQWHTPYHPSGRLLTLRSQIQGPGHSCSLAFALFYLHSHRRLTNKVLDAVFISHLLIGPPRLTFVLLYLYNN